MDTFLVEKLASSIGSDIETRSTRTGFETDTSHGKPNDPGNVVDGGEFILLNPFPGGKKKKLCAPIQNGVAFRDYLLGTFYVDALSRR
tara:strand:+ start:512 stop:775 length:264 start_codon:yes stop_codon:yes gene_type:complete